MWAAQHGRENCPAMTIKRVATCHARRLSARRGAGVRSAAATRTCVLAFEKRIRMFEQETPECETRRRQPLRAQMNDLPRAFDGRPVDVEQRNLARTQFERERMHRDQLTPMPAITACLMLSLLPSVTLLAGTNRCCRNTCSDTARVPDPGSRSRDVSPATSWRSNAARPEADERPDRRSHAGDTRAVPPSCQARAAAGP